MDVAQLPYIDERPRLTVDVTNGRHMHTLAPAAGELAACRKEEVE
jgi:hypothetical protein